MLRANTATNKLLLLLHKSLMTVHCMENFFHETFSFSYNKNNLIKKTANSSKKFCRLKLKVSRGFFLNNNNKIIQREEESFAKNLISATITNIKLVNNFPVIYYPTIGNRIMKLLTAQRCEIRRIK